jgi:uncharacterized protein YutE (UPF0331/DUF86 family)
MIKRRDLRKKDIESKVSDIIESISKVQENFPKVLGDFLNLGLVKDGIYKKVEFAIESIIDICNIINSDLRLGSPETEDDIIENMGLKNILSKKVVNIISEMKKFRNILVHRYGKIDDKKAYGTIKENMGDFELIIKEIEGFLNKNK